MCDAATRSRQSSGQPRWATLYIVAISGLTALAAAPATLTRCAVVLGIFAGIACWLRANRAAFDLQQWCDCASTQITVRVIESPRRLSERWEQPVPVRSAEVDELVHV